MEELIRRAQEKGIDVEELLLLALSKVDPEETLRLRLEMAERYLKEMQEYLKRGDAVQASEKAYKVAEELVKALAEEFSLPEYEQAVKEGRWTAYNLGKAVNELSLKLGHWVADGWSSAYFLHIWGFHEAKLQVGDLTAYVDRVTEMYEKALKVLSGDQSK